LFLIIFLNKDEIAAFNRSATPPKKYNKNNKIKPALRQAPKKI